MRKVLSLFLSCLFVVLCGCENPIQGVGLTMNPDGTFGVSVQLKGGQVLKFDNVTPGQLATLQKRYRISERQIYYVNADAGRAVDPCGNPRALLLDSFAPIQAVQTRELALCEVRDLSTRPNKSAIQRFRDVFTPKSSCSCEITTPPVVFTPTPTVPTTTGGGGGDIPTPQNDDGSFSIGKGFSSLENRIKALEVNQSIDHAKLLSVDTKLDEILAAVKK